MRGPTYTAWPTRPESITATRKEPSGRRGKRAGLTGTYETSVGAKETSELAVMLDTYLLKATAAAAIEAPATRAASCHRGE